jgi:hypothetical protein
MSEILKAGQTYIYSLTYPNTDEIRYLGKSDNPKFRLIEHVRKCKYSNTHKNNWILSLLNKNLKPILNILDSVPIDNWGFWEIYWIDLIKSWGFNLTNIASGGRGGNQGFIVNKKISNALKNRIYSSETIERMRIGAKNRKISEEGRKSLSIHRTGENNPMYGKLRPESSKKYKTIIQFDLNYNKIKIWLGVITASKELKINRCTISDVCNGRKKTAGGYIWKYAE